MTAAAPAGRAEGTVWACESRSDVVVVLVLVAVVTMLGLSLVSADRVVDELTTDARAVARAVSAGADMA